jgi:queuine tRNA-ribosyltransferase
MSIQINFKVEKQVVDSQGVGRARAAEFTVPGSLGVAHPIKTPVFMPVGTLGTVKGITPGELHQMGAQVIL